MFSGLGVPSKNENFKNDFFFSCSEFCYWAKVKAKHVIKQKIMLLNEIQAFFVSVCFFVLMLFRSNSVTFRFSLSSTWPHTNYQTMKFLPLYLQNSKRNEKQIQHWRQPLRGFQQNRFYDTLTIK